MREDVKRERIGDTGYSVLDIDELRHEKEAEYPNPIPNIQYPISNFEATIGG